MAACVIYCSFLVILLFSHGYSISVCDNVQLDTCTKCLVVTGCRWCITNTTGYCIAESDNADCEEIINPESRVENSKTKTLDQLNQVSLESLDVSLRVGEPLTFNFSVKAADRYPLDLYILMDISSSYKDDLVHVKNLAPSIADSLKNLSNDPLIGFGTFVDKQSPPFASRKQLDLSYKDKYGNPSCQKKDECSLPVAYEHVSDLTNSSDSFDKAIQHIVISTSADVPEGTLDAMMQAAVCSELVGWREDSRKVLMVMTDDQVHMAGDGRMAGILRRNDAQCQTEFNKQYNKSLYLTSMEQDYPSFEQLRLVLRRSGIVPVFAIPMGNNFNEIRKHFTIVSDLLNGYLAISSDGSANLLEVIAEAYDSVISQVALDYESPSFLHTSAQFNCPSSSNVTVQDSGRCTNIGNDEVRINMTLMLTECVANVSNNAYLLEVIVPGFDKFAINIKSECSCDCDEITETGITECVNGELKCGKCYCDNGWSGDVCNCSTLGCPSFNGQVCGGRGTCDSCGNCVCNTIDYPIGGVLQPMIFGDACECSNFDCESHSNGRVCSGHGECQCDNGMFSCNCRVSGISGEVYYGDLCQCSTDHCINPNNINGGVCSGHGSCIKPCEIQGKGCKCDESYIGDYCELYVSTGGYCGRANDSCIKCYAKAAADNNLNPMCDIDCEMGQYFILTQTQLSSYEIPGTLNGSTQECSFSTAECNYVYFVGSNLNGSDLVYAVEARSCLPLPIWALTLIIVIGFIIIAGVSVIVVVKLIIMWLDYLEYRNLVKDVKNSAKQGMQKNPVYHEADSLSDVLY